MRISARQTTLGADGGGDCLRRRRRHRAAAAAPPCPPGGRQGGGRQGPPPGGFQRPPSPPFPDAAQVVETIGAPVRVVPMFKGLATPWSLAFLPNGDMLITEKAGKLRIVRGGTLDPVPVAGTPEVFAVGQGGLLEVAVHPQFAQNQFVYLTYSKGKEKEGTTALARGRFDGKALVDVKDLLVTDNWNTGGIHFGSKLAFGKDGMLYMSVGERNDRVRAQNTNIHGGKILRLKDDGTVPPDNPFVGKTGYKPEIFTWGHRNVQALAVHPDTGAVWATEHGPQGGDELNLIEAGKNYGWPVITFGREYSGEVISAQPAQGRHGTAVHVLGAVARPLGDGDLHRRQVRGLEGPVLPRRARRHRRLARRHERERPGGTRADAQLAATAHPRRPAGPRRVPVSRRRRQSRRNSARRARDHAGRLRPVKRRGQTGVRPPV